MDIELRAKFVYVNMKYIYANKSKVIQYFANICGGWERKCI